MAAFKTDDPKLWVEFFASQHGGGGFIGDPFQRGGFSLGGLFKGLARVALPVSREVVSVSAVSSRVWREWRCQY